MPENIIINKHTSMRKIFLQHLRKIFLQHLGHILGFIIVSGIPLFILSKLDLVYLIMHSTLPVFFQTSFLLMLPALGLIPPALGLIFLVYCDVIDPNSFIETLEPFLVWNESAQSNTRENRTLWAFMLSLLGPILYFVPKWRHSKFLTGFVVYGGALIFSVSICALLFHLPLIKLIPSLAIMTSHPYIFIQLLLAVCLVAPLQTFSEELIFRGMLLKIQQRILCNHNPPINHLEKIKQCVGIVILSISNAALFAAGHISMMHGFLPALLAQGIFGLAAVYLTLKTQGIETSTGMHCANNILAILMTGELLMTPPELSNFDLSIEILIGLITCFLTVVIISFYT